MQEQPPTRKEFNELKEQVKRIEQRTEPITIPRIELDPGGIQNRLDNHAEMLKEISTKQDEQEEHLTLIYTDVGHMKADVGMLKGEMAGARADILQLKESQADFRDALKNTATKDDISRLETDITSIKATQEQILKLLQQKGDR